MKWDALRFNGIVAILNPPLVAISEIVVDNAYARLVIETNRTLNVMDVLNPPSAATPASHEPGSADLQVVPTKVQGSSVTNPPVQISIGAILLTNTTINFSDRSLEPNVRLALQSVDGSVSGLSTEAGAARGCGLECESGRRRPGRHHRHDQSAEWRADQRNKNFRERRGPDAGQSVCREVSPVTASRKGS